MVERLGVGPASIGELAAPFEMALPSFMQHLDVLEKCGMASSTKTGRTRVLQIEPPPLLLAEHWIEARRAQWEARLDQLDSLVLNLKETNR